MSMLRIIGGRCDSRVQFEDQLFHPLAGADDDP